MNPRSVLIILNEKVEGNLISGTDSKIPDIQAGFEKAMTLMMAALAGINFIYDAGGSLEEAKRILREHQPEPPDRNVEENLKKIVKEVEKRESECVG